MREKKYVSIILPAYNAEKYITKTIEAVCSQTYKNFELIIINDGSTDGTGDLCNKYFNQDSRIKYIEQANAGVGAARNLGIRMAGTEYIMFIDADDCIDNDFVEKMIDPLLDKTVDLSVCDIDNIDSATEQHRLSEIRLPIGVTETRTDKNVISKVRTFCWGKIYKKELWVNNQIKFPEGELYRSLPGFEDICCIPLVAAFAKRIAHVGDVSYHYYRGHESGLMNTAKFDYFYNSLIETMEKFKRIGLESEYHIALRKFMLGQLVSANRWPLTGNEIDKMWNFTDRYFSEIAPVHNYKIYAPDGIEYDILKNIFFDRTRLVKDKPIDMSGKENILVFNIARKNCESSINYENFCFDEADRIIDKLPQIIAENRKD